MTNTADVLHGRPSGALSLCTFCVHEVQIAKTGRGMTYEEALRTKGVYVAARDGAADQRRYIVVGGDSGNRMLYVGYGDIMQGQLFVIGDRYGKESQPFSRAPDKEQEAFLLFRNGDKGYRFADAYGKDETVCTYLDAPPPPPNEEDPGYLAATLRFDREYRAWYAELQKRKEQKDG